MKRLCELVQVERSSHYAWKAAAPSREARAAADHRGLFRWLARRNARRRHSWCGYRSPVAYETLTAATLPSAA